MTAGRRTVEGVGPDGRGLRLVLDRGLVRSRELCHPAEGPLIVPGLVDLQVNGYGGHDVNGPDANPQGIMAMAEALAREGTTCFVPTVVTGSHEAMRHAVSCIRDAVALDAGLGRAIPYVHLEGPHISPEDGARGAHDRDHVRPPSLAEFDSWQEAAGGMIGMVTLSPHWEGAGHYVRGLKQRGVRVSLGHTHATPEELRAGTDAGARYSTHLGNGLPSMLPRHPNAVWTQLADDRLTAGFIADGHHLPLDTLKAMLRGKGLERSFVVSDSVALAGAAPGRYTQPVGGEVELRGDGRLAVAGTPYLAGAALPLRHAFTTLAAVGFSRSEAVDLTAGNPSRVAGRPAPLQPGSPADLLLLSPDDLSVLEVSVAGVPLG